MINNPVVHFEIYVDDMKRAAQHGGSVEQEKTPSGEHGFMALVKDTEGSMIGLHSMK